LKLDDKVTAAAKCAVDTMMSEVRGVRASVVSTEDGFEVASRVENTAEVARLSAMASSMAALGAIAGEESKLGACRNVVIEATEGHIVMLQARRADVSLVLSIVAGPEAVMGQILYYSRRAALALESA
jgi:predicted regulator of Ras-like GTPase activity (Roadblock/LC7/MglB family)